MEQNKEYFVFISYSSLDNEWAIWLRHELEHYHLPASFNGRTDVRDNLRKVFRDRDELSAGPEWDEQVHQALANTNNLIVICSPNAAKSDAVNKEVETFISLGKEDHIFPFIVEGEKPEDCFPPALRHSKLGGDVNKDGGRDSAFVKVVAGMLKVGFPSLWDRYEKEKAEEERKIREQRDKLLMMQSRFLAEKAKDLVDKGDSYTARLLALEALPKDLENPDRPYVPEAEAVLRESLRLDSAILKNEVGVDRAIFSPSGNLILSEKPCKIWNVSSGKCIQLFKGGNAASFNYDGSLISIAFGNVICIIRIKDFKVLKKLVGKSDIIYSTQFSPDGRFLISTSAYDNVRIWDLGDCNTKCLVGHSDVNYFAKYSSDGKLIITRGFDSQSSKVIIWDAISLTAKTIINIDSVCFVDISPDNKWLSTASNFESDIKIWDVETGKCLKILKGHKGRVNSALFSPNNLQIISSSQDCTMRIWDLANEQCIKVYKVHADAVEYSCFCPKGKIILSASDDETIRLTDSQTLGIRLKIANSTKVYFESPNTIASIEDNGTVKKWMIYKGKNSITTLLRDFVDGSMIISPDGKWGLVLINNDEEHFDNDDNSWDLIKRPSDIFVWNMHTGELLYTLKDYISAVVFSCDSKRIIAGCPQNTKILDVQTGKLIDEVRTSENSPYCMAISPDNILIQGDFCGEMTIININSREKRTIPCKSVCWLYSIAISNDGKRFVTASADKKCRIYNIDDKDCIRVFEGHTDDVELVLFSPNGKTIASSSHDKTVKIWDIETGICVITLGSFQNDIVNIAYNQDGSFIAISLKDRTTSIIEIPSLQQIIDQTSERFKDRQLTTEERKKYYLD